MAVEKESQFEISWVSGYILSMIFHTSGQPWGNDPIGLIWTFNNFIFKMQREQTTYIVNPASISN